MKKRLISILLTVFMLISMLSVFPFTVSAAPNISFTYNPALLIGGEKDYNIVWMTNTNSIGYVTYTYKGQTYTVYDERDGVVVTDDYIHSVKVPMEHLNAAGKYTVTSAGVDSRTGYTIKLGTASSKEGKVKYTAKEDGYKIGCFSDIHLFTSSWADGPLKRSIHSLNNYMKGVDMILLPGDLVTFMTDDSYLKPVFNALAEFSADGTPVLYILGNHECRGITAQRLPHYFGFSETEDLYGRIKFGNIEFLATFCAEDKIDAHQEYGDLNAMEHYKAEEYEWFYNCGGFVTDAKYRISTSHSHNLVDVYYTNEFLSRVSEYNPDIHINGHTHALKLDKNPAYDFPFLHDGAHTDNTTMRTTLVELNNGTYTITGFDDSGNVILSDNTTKAKHFKSSSAPTEQIQEEVITEPQAPVSPETEVEDVQTEAVENTDSKVPTAAGVKTSTLKGAATTTAFTTKPVVFDAGAYYNVVWQTTPGVDATGEVIVSTGDVKLRYRTQVIGKITTDTTHSARIPKQSFGNCKYEAKVRVVIHYTYGGYVTSPPTSYGAYTSAGQISFKGEPNAKQNKFTYVAIAGTKTASNAAKIKSEIGNKTPDMLITLGNMVDAYNTEKDFGNYLKIVEEITAGKYPVMFIRGENETKGEFAAHIGDYIRNFTSEAVMGKFYLNTSYDVVSLFGLDTSTAKPDKEYNQYAGFDRIRQEQASWLTNTLSSGNSGDYNIVFANSDNLKDCAGTDFTPGLKNINANVTITAGSGKTAFSLGLDTYSKVTCGTPDGDGTLGLHITCADETITVKKLGGDTLGEIDVKSSSAGKDDSIDDSGSSNGNGNSSSSGNGNSSSSGNGNSSSSGNGNSSSSGSSSGSSGGSELIKGEFDGVDNDTYIREVSEDWYKAYASLNIASSTAAPKSNGKTTEAEFINMVANLSSINLYLYNGSTNAEKAADWAYEEGIYTGTLTNNPVSDNVISVVLGALDVQQ